MDQMTASCGQQGRLMKLLCQPADLIGFVDLPVGTSVWGIDSGVRHDISGSAYSDVRTAAFMGLRIIEDAGTGEEPGFGGYLANVGSAALNERYGHLLPVRMEGREFLGRYGDISDTVVSVDPDRRYRVRAATAHPILEHERINRFADLLEADPADPESCALAGRLMFLSHEGYSSCGLGSGATDAIVSMVREADRSEGLFGARITGGGSGGTVAILGRDDAYGAIERIADRYERETGRGARIFET
jgi:L-arabinokinase